MKKLMLSVALASLGFGAVAEDQVQGVAEGESVPAFVWVQPGTSTFWHTATNHVLTVPILFPEGATLASLSVRGDRYSAEYEVQKTGECADCTISLPEPKMQLDEDVYSLELRFDDENETVRNARLGLIRSATDGSDCPTRCLVPADGRKWSKTAGRAVLWIPFGMTSLTVNGTDVDPMLGGDQGWYAVTGLALGHDAQVEMNVGGESYAANLRGGPGGLFIVIK